MKRLVGLVIAIGTGLVAAGQGLAQSAYGCDDLARLGDMPVVEGRGGVFYRVHPDMHNFYSFSDETVERVGELSDTLAALGTRLVYVPVPTKSLAMPAFLTPEADDFGFDPDMATTVYLDILKRLEQRGVAAVDVRKAMVQTQNGAPAYFQSDHRWTATGARLAAGAVAERIAGLDGTAGLPTSAFANVQGSDVTLSSHMFAQIQQHCQGAIPPVTTAAFTTSAPTLPGGTPVVVVGTEYSGEVAGNFSGFLAQASGLAVAQYSVPGGGAFAAISSYLASDVFRAARPALLVWEVPVEANPGRFGDQPMRELIAFAGNGCRLPLSLSSTDRDNRINVDLGPIDPGLATALLIDGAGAQSREAVFTFRSRTGLTRTRTVVRHPDQPLNGRFAMPLSGLWPEGAVSVEVELSEAFGPAPGALACFYEGQG